MAVSTHKYKWLYLYGFVRPATGTVEWWLANSVNVPLFQSVLEENHSAAPVLRLNECTNGERRHRAA